MIQRHPYPGNHNIKSWFYWPEAQCLEIEFRQSIIYRYFHVEPAKAEAFEKAESKGSYFALNIRHREQFPFIPLKAGEDQTEPKADDFERWLQRGEDELKDIKIFERDRAADRAGMLGETRRARKMRLL
jgi:hypothetical protein